MPAIVAVPVFVTVTSVPATMPLLVPEIVAEFVTVTLVPAFTAVVLLVIEPALESVTLPPALMPATLPKITPPARLVMSASVPIFNTMSEASNDPELTMLALPVVHSRRLSPN